MTDADREAWDRERIRRAVEDGEYCGDVAPLLAAECRRLAESREALLSDWSEIETALNRLVGLLHGSGLSDGAVYGFINRVLEIRNAALVREAARP